MPPILPVALCAALLALVAPVRAHAHVVAEDSFEEPAVTERQPRSHGGDPTQTRELPPFWQCLEDQPNLGAEGGSLVAGLTNETARTGRQCLYVEAHRLRAAYLGVHWASKALPVEAGRYYSLTLWYRNASSAGPEAAAGAAPLYLNLQVGFYSDQGERETGDSLYRVQALDGRTGGGRKKPSGTAAASWSPLRFGFQAPEGARTLSVSFRCDGRVTREAVTGTVFFDDFSLREEIPPGDEKTLANRVHQKRAKGNTPSKRLFACRR